MRILFSPENVYIAGVMLMLMTFSIDIEKFVNFIL